MQPGALVQYVSEHGPGGARREDGGAARGWLPLRGRGRVVGAARRGPGKGGGVGAVHQEDGERVGCGEVVGAPEEGGEEGGGLGVGLALEGAENGGEVVYY